MRKVLKYFVLIMFIYTFLLNINNKTFAYEYPLEIYERPEQSIETYYSNGHLWNIYSENKNHIEYKSPSWSKYPYKLCVNRAYNTVTVYGIDMYGEYTIPVKAFACSCGRENHDTILGNNFKVTDKYVWRLMVDYSYGKYAVRFSGSYMFHSVPYLAMEGGTTEKGEFNKLGSYSSLGCVRLNVKDAKWIYENCLPGTYVCVYEDFNSPGPLGKPDTIKVPSDMLWDPTDDSINNPYKDKHAEIINAKDIYVKQNSYVNLLKDVKAYDTCGNDITNKIIIEGEFSLEVKGEYDINYIVTDAIGSRKETSVKLYVY